MSFWPYAAQVLSSLVFIRQIGRQGIAWDKEKSDLRLWRQKFIYFLQFSKLTFFSAHPHVLFFAQWCCSFYKRSCHKEEISCATSYGDLISQPWGRDSSRITTCLHSRGCAHVPICGSECHVLSTSARLLKCLQVLMWKSLWPKLSVPCIDKTGKKKWSVTIMPIFFVLAHCIFVSTCFLKVRDM